MVTTRNQAQNPSHGQKVTDPNAPTIKEGAGAVASDSLAAESTRSGGAFSENRDSEPLGVSGSNSTFANTDTSGASTLGPAPDAEARGDAGTESYPRSVGGQAKDLAVEDTSRLGESRGSGGSIAGVAPNYVASQYVDGGLPKGKNLTEGGFEDGDDKNASFTSEIGSKNDPGRLAEQKFQRQNADAAEDAGMPRQQGVTGDNSYDALSGETST